MPLHNLFPRGTPNEHRLYESLIIESIRHYGVEFYYIPRQLVAKDDVFVEDRLSTFKDAYMIEGYVDEIDGFSGQGNFMSKFGLVIEEQASVTVAVKRWEELVGRFGTTIIPDRPNEGDLFYFPTSDTLFEIKYVENQQPFYQLGKLYVYKLRIEAFQYSSERINTGIEEIDSIALNNTFDLSDRELIDEEMGLPFVQEDESGNVVRDDSTIGQEERVYGKNSALSQEAEEVLKFDESNPFGNL